ncbi:hypothetical protein AcW1_000420 [Taiwanofungus camphoratus]|nr:hypothetical protein AcW2_001083 [Antrodia cinnamomea]KAI0936097.1 hypothetical protein AcV5_004321 [Antrodia cinnamomea]KAI0961305.1 hypothetical protein AcV7_000440 [Antrodia cinnamomea]KAI0963310.1 hypothetical protein AcW1_000420 [Antrodia cinnamomea]
MIARQAIRLIRHPSRIAQPIVLAASSLHAPTRQQLARQGVVPAQYHGRHFATPPPQVVHSDLPLEKYHEYSDATMDKMLESLENLLDEVADPNHEVEYSSGVLTLKLGDKGTYVINKQPPNKQIWLSSPFRCALHVLCPSRCP